LTKDGSQGSVDAINGITHAMESSGVTMNNFLTEWMSEWALLKASIKEVWVVLSTPLSLSWREDIKKQIDKIEYDLSVELAKIHTPAQIWGGGRSWCDPPGGRRHEAHEDG
jgi:hypothetical protein